MTGKGGAAARAAHDLSILVQRWQASVHLADDPTETTMSLTADARSLRVLDGTGGMTALGDDDKAGITQTIDDEVLQGTAISFRSTDVAADGEARPATRPRRVGAGRARPIPSTSS